MRTNLAKRLDLLEDSSEDEESIFVEIRVIDIGEDGMEEPQQGEPTGHWLTGKEAREWRRKYPNGITIYDVD